MFIIHICQCVIQVSKHCTIEKWPKTGGNMESKSKVEIDWFAFQYIFSFLLMFNILKVSFAFQCKNVVVWLIKKNTDQTLCVICSA